MVNICFSHLFYDFDICVIQMLKLLHLFCIMELVDLEFLLCILWVACRTCRELIC